MEHVSDGHCRFVIVLGSHDNTLGVSVLGVSPWADTGAFYSTVHLPRHTGARVAMGGGGERFMV